MKLRFTIVCLLLCVLLARVSFGAPIGRSDEREANRNATVFTASNGVQGVDVSNPTSQSAFQCLVNNHGVSYAAVRCYRSAGRIDSSCASNVANAQSAGIGSIDLYHFPCMSVGASAQIQAVYNYVQNQGIQFNMYWIDVEAQAWGGSTSSNINFISRLVNAAQSVGLGNGVGIYTSRANWNQITGGTSQFSSLPLWTAHYDGSPSFNDWVPYGGWSSPQIKQYQGDAVECGVGVDLDYYP